jgi:hypothetical protein
MKKKLLLFAIVFFSLKTFATVTGTHIVIPSNITWNSATTQDDATLSFTGSTRPYGIYKKINDTVWKTGDTMPSTSGNGIKPFTFRNLASSTTYEWKTVYPHDGINDTMIAPASFFTTKAAPAAPIFSIISVPKLDTSLLIVSVTNATGYYPTLYVLYGDALQNASNSISWKTGAFTDTFKLVTPIPDVEVNYYFKYDAPTTVPVRDTSVLSSFRTPALTDGSVTAYVLHRGIDSITVRTSITVGTVSGRSQLILKDSAGLNTIQSSPVRSTNVNETYDYTFRSLSQNTSYKPYVLYADTLDADTVTLPITRTLLLPSKPAPAVAFTGNLITDCNKFTTGISLTPATGDSAYGIMLRGLDGVLTDTIFRTTPSTTPINLTSFTLPAPLSGRNYMYKWQGFNRAGDKFNEAVLYATSPAGHAPNGVMDITGMTIWARPTISVSGNIWCSVTTIHVVIQDINTLAVVYDTIIDVGTGGQYTRNWTLPVIPNGNFVAKLWVNSQYGGPFQDLYFYGRNIVLTGIRTNTLEKVKVGPNPTHGLLTISGIETGEVNIVNLSGQQVFKGLVSDRIDISSYPAGMYILQISNDEGAATVKLEKN